MEINKDLIESITKINFSIYPNEIMIDSRIPDPNGIIIQEIHDNNESVEKGVIDKRLGIMDKCECDTCGETALKCPGHFGHIKLVEPVFHIGFLSFVKNILSCVCIRCNKLLIYKTEEEIAKLVENKQGKQRFAEIRNICKSVTQFQKDNHNNEH